MSIIENMRTIKKKLSQEFNDPEINEKYYQ